MDDRDTEGGEETTRARDPGATGAGVPPGEETPAASRPPVSPPRRRVRETVFAVALIGLVGLFFGLPSLPEPFGVDQGIYAYIAERLLEGAVDHRDVFDHKPPGIHVAYAAAFALLGHRMSSVRVFDLAAAFLTALGLYALGRLWGSIRLGLIAGLLYMVYYEAYFDWMSRAQPETWVNLTCVAGLALVAGGRTWLAMLTAGILLGAGLWFKPTIVPLALIWLAVLADRAWREADGGWRRFVLHAVSIGAGAAALSLAVLLYYVANRALSDLYEAVVVFNTRYHTRLGLVGDWRPAGKAIGFMARPVYALAVLSLAGAATAVVPARRRPPLFALGWLVVAFATVFWQGSTAKSHYVLVLPPMVLLTSLALDGAVELAKRAKQEETGRRAVVLAALAVAACLLLVNVAGLFQDRWTKYCALAGGRISHEQYYGSFWLKGAPGRGGYSFEDLRQMGRYLEENTAPDQTIYVWGFRPLVAYLARRRMPTRFIFRYPLTRADNARWWDQFLSDLDRSPPAYFVVVVRDRGRYHPTPSDQALMDHAALRDFLRSRYELDRTLTDFEIYRLRPPPER